MRVIHAMIIDRDNAGRFAAKVVASMISLGCDASTMRRHKIPTSVFYGVLGGGYHRGGLEPSDVAKHNISKYRHDYLGIGERMPKQKATATEPYSHYLRRQALLEEAASRRTAAEDYRRMAQFVEEVDATIGEFIGNLTPDEIATHEADQPCGGPAVCYLCAARAVQATIEVHNENH